METGKMEALSGETRSIFEQTDNCETVSNQVVSEPLHPIRDFMVNPSNDGETNQNITKKSGIEL